MFFQPRGSFSDINTVTFRHIRNKRHCANYVTHTIYGSLSLFLKLQLFCLRLERANFRVQYPRGKIITRCLFTRLRLFPRIHVESMINSVLQSFDLCVYIYTYAYKFLMQTHGRIRPYANYSRLFFRIAFFSREKRVDRASARRDVHVDA